MKLKLEEGCVCDSITVDGIEEVDMTDKQRIETIEAIFNWYKNNPKELNFFLQWFIGIYGTAILGERCEHCGDTPITYTLEIQQIKNYLTWKNNTI